LPARKRFLNRSGTHVPTRQELRVIELVAQGVKTREIAKELRIGEKVIGSYLRRIYDKIGVRNRVELALWYWARKQEDKPS